MCETRRGGGELRARGPAVSLRSEACSSPIRERTIDDGSLDQLDEQPPGSDKAARLYETATQMQQWLAALKAKLEPHLGEPASE